MEAKSRIVIAGVVVLAVVLWSASGRGEFAPSPVPDAPRGEAPTPVAEPVMARAAVAPTPAVAEAPAPAQPRSELPAAASKNATLHGRCVGAQGEPLAECKVHLLAWVGNSERMDQWFTDHGEKPEWKELPDVITGAGGEFSFVFWPPPPFQFALDVTRDGCGAMSGRWSTLAEGSDTNVGDIAMTVGVRVTGRVVDADGAPQEREYVTLNRSERSDDFDRVAPRWGDQAVSKADGTFATHGWVVPGEYAVGTQKLELQSPKQLTLTAERPREEITVVVAKPRATATITGRVLDETGAPAHDVRIEDRSDHGWASATSRRDGTFELKQQRNNGDKAARLVLYSVDYEFDAKEPRDVAWGSTDVEFRVARAGALTLRVTDPQQAPVDSYTMWLIPRNRGRFSSLDSRARTQGKHPDGTVVIDGMTRGDWLLLVDFAAPTGFQSLFEVFSHEGGPRRMDLTATPAKHRMLRVVAGGDTPVAGTMVQLCEVFDQPFDDARLVMRREQWLSNSGSQHALVVFEGATGPDGRVELRGPGGHTLGLSLLGPGHVPLRQSGIQLEVADELVVRVSQGARLTGSIVPPEAVAELKRLAGGKAGEGFGRLHPRIGLIDARKQRFPKDHVMTDDLKSLLVADDGSFTAVGLPPGSWQVVISGWISDHDRGATGHDFPAGNVVLVDGQTTTRDLDLAYVLPGTIDGLVLLNGQPFGNDTVTIHCEGSWTNLQTDAEGRFRRSIFAGDYHLLLQKKLSADTRAMLRCATPVHVGRGETTTQTFAVVSTTLRVTVLDASGKPLAAVRLYVLGSDKDSASWLPPTDESGRAETELTTETVTLRILPKEFSSQEAQRKLWQEGQARGETDPLGRLWIPLQTVVLAAGQTSAVEVRLPVSAGY